MMTMLSNNNTELLMLDNCKLCLDKKIKNVCVLFSLIIWYYKSTCVLKRDALYLKSGLTLPVSN